MPRAVLTAEYVRKVKAPESGRAVHSDVAVPGLVLRVTEKGVKSWCVCYRVANRRVNEQGRVTKGPTQRLTLGSYPAVDLTKARQRARAALELASEGRDPVRVACDEARQRFAEESMTFRQVAGEFVKRHVRPRVKEHKLVERFLELHVLPSWADRPVSELRRSDVHELLDTLQEERSASRAQEARKHLSTLFNWAVDRALLPASPMAGLQRSDLGYAERERVLSDDELRLVWRAAGTLGYPFGPLYKLLILTGQRRDDWASARRSWLGEHEGRAFLHIPKTEYKGARDHVVPLSPLAREIVDGLPHWATGDYLLSTTAGRRPVSGFSRALTRLREAIHDAQLDADPEAKELPRFTPHDFRRTVKSGLSALRVPAEHKDAVLGHAKHKLDKIYDHHNYFAEKAEALDRWAAHVEEIVK